MEKNQNIKICRNGLVALDSRQFKVDKELKEEFLSDKHPNTSKQIKITLLKAENSEIELKKSLYSFTLDDIENMIFTDFPYKTEKALKSKISHLRNYVEFCIRKNYAEVNNFKLVYKLKKYENTIANKIRYITFENFIKYENILANPSDKLLLELLFLGLTQEEICNLKKSDISFAEKTITVEDDKNNKKVIENIPDRLIKIASDNETTEEYYSNNADDSVRYNKAMRKVRSKVYKIPPSPYVFSPCHLTGNKVTNEQQYIKSSKTYVQYKMTKFRIWLDNPYLGTTSVRMSGIAYFTMKYIEKKGGEDKMTIDDYDKIYRQFYNGAKKDKKSAEFFRTDIKNIISLIKRQDI